MVNEWVSDLGRRGFSSSRIRQSYRLLSQVMRSAVENDLISVSPCRGVRLPRMPQTEPVILSEVQADRLIAEAASPHDLLVMMLAYGGLRIGQAFALRRRSFDVAPGLVTISENLVEIRGRLSFDTPKSHERRSVVLPDFVVVRVVEHLSLLPSDPASLLFPTGRGGPQHYQGWRKAYFDPAVKASALSGVTPHDLRASHATWVAQRHGVMAAARRLGHAHASVTTRHYARVAEGHDQVVARQIAASRARRHGKKQRGARKGHGEGPSGGDRS